MRGAPPPMILSPRMVIATPPSGIRMCEHDDNPSNAAKRGRRLYMILFLLSFVPYSFPPEKRPPLYRGASREEISKRQTIRELNAIVGGDITKSGLWEE